MNQRRKKRLSSFFFLPLSWFSKLKPKCPTSSKNAPPARELAGEEDGGGGLTFAYYTDDELDAPVLDRRRGGVSVKGEERGGGENRGGGRRKEGEEQRRSVDISRGMRRRRWKRRRRSTDKCGKLREMEMVAVVKVSVNPEGDFRESMVEMVKGKTVEELEKLLECYLILNSGDCHHLIIKVFREVWSEMKWRK